MTTSKWVRVYILSMLTFDSLRRILLLPVQLLQQRAEAGLAGGPEDDLHRDHQHDAAAGRPGAGARGPAAVPLPRHWSSVHGRPGAGAFIVYS